MKKIKKYLIILLLLIVGVGIGFSVLNSTLTINGTTNIKKNNWNVYVDNIIIKDGSVDAVVEPEINNSSLYFEIALDKPGDFYEFTFDVVNGGTLDAMIEEINMDYDYNYSSFEELTEFLDVVITYENDVKILPNHLLKTNSSVKYKVKVRYKDEIGVENLPTSDASFDFNVYIYYTQADGFVVDPNEVIEKEELKIISGDLVTTGSEFCIAEECFYVLGVEDDLIGTLPKYNLDVGNIVYDIESGDYTPLEEPTGLQSHLAKGLQFDSENLVLKYPFIGCYPYSKNGETDYYDSDIKEVIDYYAEYITGLGYPVYWYGLLYKEILYMAGCDFNNNTCANTGYDFVYSTSFWIDLDDDDNIYGMMQGGNYGVFDPSNEFIFGVRPMISFHKDVLLGN